MKQTFLMLHRLWSISLLNFFKINDCVTLGSLCIIAMNKRRRSPKGKKKMKKQAHKVRNKEVLDMLLRRKDGPMHNRTGDVRKGKSRKVKHKGRRDY